MSLQNHPRDVQRLPGSRRDGRRGRPKNYKHHNWIDNAGRESVSRSYQIFNGFAWARPRPKTECGLVQKKFRRGPGTESREARLNH